MKLNLNTILLVLAGLGVFAPDIASVAALLASFHIAWLGTVIKGLGLLAAFCSAAPLVVPRLRAFLALLGLATPPGAVAPWTPGRDAGPPAAVPGSLVGRPTPPAGSPGPSSADPVVRKGTGYGDKGSATIVQFLVLAAIAAAMVLLFAIPAHAQTLGHCLLTNADGTCKLVVQPDIIKPVLDLNLKTGKVSGGIDVAALGACWGATYQPAAWYASGFDLCFNLVGSQTSPTVLYPSGTVHFLNYGMIGAGPYCAADGVNGAFECQWHLLLGGNLALDFGPNASAAAAKKAKAERDASAEQTK